MPHLFQHCYLLPGILLFCSISLAEVQTRNELFRGNGGEPLSLDPHYMNGPKEATLAYDLFEGLTTYDSEGKLTPGQAESWHTENKGLIWTFRLRSGLKWSDGTPLTAGDFEYSFKRLANPETGAVYPWFLETLEIKNAHDIINGHQPPEKLGVKAVSDTNLEIYLEQPVSYLPELLAFYGFLPVPEHSINRWREQWTMPEKGVYNGAFRLQNWKVNESIRLSRNPYYRSNHTTRLDAVTYITSGDELSQYRAGHIDMMGTLKKEQEDWARKNDPIHLYYEPWMSVTFLFINLKIPQFQNSSSRQALALSLDREIIASSGSAGMAQPAWQVVPPNFPDFKPGKTELLQMPLPDRINKARSLNRIKELTITYCSHFSSNKAVAISVAQQWSKHLGIKIHLLGHEQKHYLEQLEHSNYQVAVTRWVGPYEDPLSLLNIFKSSSPHNRCSYQSPEFDKILRMARTTPAEQIGKKMDICSALEELLMKDVPVIPVIHSQNSRLISDRVHGYTGKNIMGRIYSRHLYLR